MQKIIFSILFTFLLVSCFGKGEEVVKQESKLNLSNTGTTNTGVTSTGVTNNSTGTTSSNTGTTEQKTEESSLETSGLEKDLDDFNINYQKALKSTSEGNQISIGLTKNITEQWGSIISKYRGYKVKGFEKTTDFDDKLVAVGINLLNASDFVTSGKMDLAHEELQKVNVVISKIKQENNIKSISDDMVSFSMKLDEIVSHPEIKDTKKFEDLRLLIKKLSEYNKDNKDYKAMLSDFEKDVINVTQLSGEQYKTRLKELKASFAKINSKYVKR